MRDVVVKNFKYGVVNNIEAQSIPRGAASDSLNWLTKGDKIELRRGYEILGTEQVGVGNITGLFVAHKANGDTIKFAKRGRKLLYFDTVTEDWVEISTNFFPAAAENDYVSFAEYTSAAGNQLWISSPNSSLYKIMTANPASFTDMYNASKNFKGYIRIKNNRMGLWGRIGDLSGYYGSYIDNQIFTTVSGEATTSLTGTLAFKAAGAKRTCFGVTITITGTGEVYTDNYNGVLTGSLGGTGTINYTTGAYTLSNSGVGTASYQWEDSTNKGIADFTKSGSRLAGEGFIFRQDDGGPLMNIESYGDTEYCLHKTKTWALTLTATDTNATNLIFRERAGIPSNRASVATGDGIYYIDVSDENKPRFKLITLAKASNIVIPSEVSLSLDLTGYSFDNCDFEEWNDYIVFTGRTLDSDKNNRMFVYHKTWKSIDILDYYSDCLAIDGELLSGESVTYNIVKLFSSFSDDKNNINNYWISNLDNLSINDRLKKVRKLIVNGLIQSGQSLDIYFSVDNGAYVLLGNISGDGSYVEAGQNISVGSTTIGSKTIGGVLSEEFANSYLRQIIISLNRFDSLKLKVVATGIGYASLSEINYHDIRLKSARVPIKNRG